MLKAARYVTKMNKGTKICKLLDQCNWLSIKQLTILHSLVLLKKIWSQGTWNVLKNGLRMEADGTFAPLKRRILLTQYSWKKRSIDTWNILPADIRMESKMNVFKKKVRTWVKEHGKI